ncbi:MAG: COX15/CtaA family protein [Methylotenera sp.]|nr:COX15/CtaA family protein [Oligoflexia bacterium]
MTITVTRKSALRFPVLVLLYTVAVIVWGAFVRATGSGAGCGEHWPLCNGVVLPRAAALQTVIEFTHRVTSGLSLLLIIGMAVWAFRKVRAGHLLRKAATFSVVFILTEALIGAGLVLLGLVAKDQSLTRAASLALHLANTFILIACLTGAVAWSEEEFSNARWRIPTRRDLILATTAFTVSIWVGVSGAVAALGDTLFPSTSGSGSGPVSGAGTVLGGIRADLAADFSSASHFLIRLRVVHPFSAVALAIFLVIYAQYLRGRPTAQGPQGSQTGLQTSQVQLWTLILTLMVFIQVGIGFVNLGLRAPVWIQLVHLGSGNVLWIALILSILYSYTEMTSTPVVKSGAID